MNKFLLALFFAASTLTVCGQATPAYQSLLDTVTKNSGLFISAHPIRKLNLNVSDTFLYRDRLKYEYGYAIDRELLIELISNSNNPDTTKWSVQDLKGFVRVETPEGFINPGPFLKQLGALSKEETKKLKRQIRDYNNTRPFDRNIFYFSRPVFDRTRSFAVVSHGSGHPGLLGRDYISLFHYDGNAWTKIGVLDRWIY